MLSPPPGPLQLRIAAEILQLGGVIGCPTEAVWGLSCDPGNDRAIDHLLTMKRRPEHKGLILVAADERQLAFLLDGLRDDQRQVLSASWPGPNTWLVPHHGRVSPLVSGRHDSIAVRVSAHPVVQALCRAFGGPLVSTSANRGGARPARHAFQVWRYFRGDLDYLLSGRLGSSGRPSSIRDLASGEIIRE